MFMEVAMLATLDDLKGKLDVSSADTSRDDALLLVLESASAKILDLCRYSETDQTGVQQTFRDIQYNRDLWLDLRPITIATNQVVFEGRPLGQGADGTQPDWSKLTGDVIDEQEGRVIVLGAQGWWPPVRGLQPKFDRWRDPEWPIIRVTYDVTGIGSAPSCPSELRDATAALAAFWFERDLAGAKETAQIGQVQTEWMDEALPVTFTAKLGKHLKGQAARWV